MGAVDSVEGSMFRSLALLRAIVAVNTIAIFIFRGLTEHGGHWANFAHPWAGAAAMAAMVVWTALISWWFRSADRRTPVPLVLDLIVSAAILVSSRFIILQPSDETISSFWVSGVVLIWAARWGRWGGAVAAAVISSADLAIKPHLSSQYYGNVFLLFLGGWVLGSAVELLRRVAAERDAVQGELVATQERAALARVVHDGTLQVLALVQRKGAQSGGSWADLGRLAGEQEVALRSFVQRAAPRSTGGLVDLSDALAALGAPDVTASVPGERVDVDVSVGSEVLAVVAECLANARRHAPSAHIWIALESLGDSIAVTVRDDGPGIASGRLEAAKAQGRLGVAESIRGRIEQLGGSADLHTGPGQGTEWEFRIPSGSRH